MRSSFTLSCLSLLLALGAGCAPGNPGLVIDGVIAPPTGGGCTYDATATVFLLEGTLDTFDLPTTIVPDGVLGARYVAYLRVANRLVNRFSGTYPLRADPNVMTLIAADIQINNIDGSLTSFPGLPNPFRVVASGVVPSASSESPGVAVTAVEFIPPQYAAALGTVTGTVRLLVSARIIGRTSGDAGVQSNPFVFPIDVCTDCLYSCVATPDDAAFGCNVGQDTLTFLPPGVAPCP